jgi:hypothetical protein
MLGFKHSIHDGFERKTQEVSVQDGLPSACLPDVWLEILTIITIPAERRGIR